MVSRAKKMKIENWNSSMIEKIKKKKKKKEKMRTKFSGWLCFLFCYITQNPGPFGGCAGIPRLFIRQACSSSRWAALLSSCFTKVQRRSAVALAWGHIFGCTLFLENEITRYIILSLLPSKKKKKTRSIFTYRNKREQIINDYLSTNSPHMHASPPSIKWDEFTVLLNAKGSHA